MNVQTAINRAIERFGPSILPFADAATPDLPLPRLLRLSLFQVSVGMAAVLLIGTLNRVMIVELGVPASVVAAMIALPLLLAPLRALVGFRSDNHRSYLGWRRVPYIWQGTLLQWGGLAIMPFALMVLSDEHSGPDWLGPVSAAAAFLMVGAGMHVVQTAGLALAADLAPQHAQARVVALLSLMQLMGMFVSALAFGALLEDFSPLRLVQVIQSCAVITAVLNLIALWKQEPRNPQATRHDRETPGFVEAWRGLSAGGRWGRRLLAVGLGAAAFSMQDILLEPYGGQILGLSVARTTMLTAGYAAGGIAAFALAARWLSAGVDAHRIAGLGCVAGVFAFGFVVMAAPLESPALFGLGATFIGAGAGLFLVGTLAACVALARPATAGLVLGAWGAAQATSAGLAMALGGVLRDVIIAASADGALGEAMAAPATGYLAVYLLEIALLFATLVVLGPLVRPAHQADAASSPSSSLAVPPPLAS